MSDGISCNFVELKKRAKELLDALPTLNDDERDNMVKMFKISYLNMTGNRNECYQASLLLHLILQKTDQLEVYL